MRINHNITAMETLNYLNINQQNLNKALEQLSSGRRINSAADDAAGLAISNQMLQQTTGMEQAVRNANDGISLVQTAEGTLNDTSDILNTLYSLAVQAANGTYTAQQQSDIQQEVNQLLSQIDANANVQFNGQVLLNGSVTTITLQIGWSSTDTMGISLTNMTSAALGLSGLTITSSTALASINAAIQAVSTERSQLGAYQNRLQHTINNLNVNDQNLTAAYSQITDVDMAQEMSVYTKDNILVQAAQSMLAQANQQPQSVLQLLQA
jgi:flagellin